MYIFIYLFVHNYYYYYCFINSFISSPNRQNSTASTAPLLSGSPPVTDSSETDGPSAKESQSSNGPLHVMEKLEEEEGVSAKPTNQIESNSEDGEKLLVSDTRPTDNEN